MAVSEEEHMVSIGMLGPVRSRKYDSRLATELNDVVGKNFVSRIPASVPYKLYPGRVIPAKTPTFGPYLLRRLRGVWPAFSNACQAPCRKSRSWGSMFRASRGAIPKKRASNSANRSRNPPHFE